AVGLHRKLGNLYLGVLALAAHLIELRLEIAEADDGLSVFQEHFEASQFEDAGAHVGPLRKRSDLGHHERQIGNHGKLDPNVTSRVDFLETDPLDRKLADTAGGARRLVSWRE